MACYCADITSRVCVEQFSTVKSSVLKLDVWFIRTYVHPHYKETILFFCIKRLPTTPLLFQLQFSLAVVLGSVHAVVRVVDKVWPCEDVRKCGGVTRVPVCNSLHVLGHLGGSVQRLALLDFVDHLAHVHLDLAAVLAGTVEAHYRRS